MNYKKLSITIQKIENDFEKSLKDFKNDEIFKKSSNVYLKKDKQNLYKKWKKISSIFLKLKFIISSYSFSLFFKRDYNSFIIKHYCIILYYNMTLVLQETFKNHEDFIRQYLDENYNENYSTIARYIYKANFLYYLNYPEKFLNLIENKISTDLKWMLKKEINYKIKLDFDYKNFYYYFKFKFDKILYFFIKYFWLFLSKIRFKISDKWYISKDCINEFYKFCQPWDILLSRQTFVATNISIPGFWKHMAMYIWTWEYLKNNFKNDIFKNLENNIHYIIESTSKWVCIEKFEDFIYKLDYLWVFRTTFSNKKIKNAIMETSKMLTYKYDYLFNYYSDSSFVCSELITKAYLKDYLDDEWLTIELQKVTSRLTYPPNELVIKAYSEKDLENKEIYPIIFIDSNLKKQISFIATNDELLNSYKRSRFSFFLK